MWFSDARKLKVPAPSQALPGRAEKMPVAAKHAVLGTPLAPPFPASMRTVTFGMGCFWGAEKKFWELPGVFSTQVGYAGGTTPNPTYREVCSGGTGHTEVVRVVYDPAKVTFEELLRVFWENHDPTQGMRQGNDVGTQYRSGIYVARGVPGRAHQGGSRSDHDGDRAAGGVLLRRGLSPAVPGEESGRLLRPRRHGRLVPGGPGEGGRRR